MRYMAFVRVGESSMPPLIHADDGPCYKTRKTVRLYGYQNEMDTDLRTVAAAVVDTVHAPPAMTFLQDEQPQIPTADLFTES